MQEITWNNQNIPIVYKPSRRVKRISLRLSPKELAFILTHPPRAPYRQLQLFLDQCGPWIKQQLEKVTNTPFLHSGTILSLYGEDFKCIHDPLRRKPMLCQETKTLYLPPKFLQKDLHPLFKKIAHEKFLPLLYKVVETLGQRVEKVSFRDSKTRWGSCSGRKTISLNWRLVFLPPEVGHYVCVHEAAHLLHMNHSKAFWEVVERICPTYKQHRKWLKINGSAWMRF